MGQHNNIITLSQRLQELSLIYNYLYQQIQHQYPDLSLQYLILLFAIETEQADNLARTILKKNNLEH